MVESLVSTLYNTALCKIKIIDEISSCIDFIAKIVWNNIQGFDYFFCLKKKPKPNQSCSVVSDILYFI